MYSPVEIQRIDRQIEDLQRLKSNMQSMGVAPQPPINNIITTPQQMMPTQPIFEAKFTTENPSDILVNNKTAFINLRDGKLSIKEVDGEIIDADEALFASVEVKTTIGSLVSNK